MREVTHPSILENPNHTQANGFSKDGISSVTSNIPMAAKNQNLSAEYNPISIVTSPNTIPVSLI